MMGWDRYFHGRYLALRPYLFAKLFLAMVALDTWLLMLGHAGRYGIAGFNVAHFAWLDRLAPRPSAALYVGVLLLTGLFSLTVAALGPTPLRMAVLCLLYTYSWAMSMLDSYQHHYFVSLVMLCMVGFPRLAPQPALDLTADRSARSAPVARLTHGFGFPLLCATVSILYVFTSVAKLEPQWCRGYTLQRLARAPELFAPLTKLAGALGMTTATFWSTVSISVIPVELGIAVSYALAPYLDDTSRRWPRLFTSGGFVLAISLHVGAELLGLEIGLFSYYMFTLAAACLLPPRVWQWLDSGLSRASQALVSIRAEASAQAQPGAFETWLLTICAGGTLAAVGAMLDLPGAFSAMCCAVLALCLMVGLAQFRGRAGASHAARNWALTVGFSGLCMWAAIAASEVRWDYYRFLGGDLQRRGETRAALHAYLVGERYAPKGQSRRNRIRELQRQLAER